jgi:hypothetical protein
MPEICERRSEGSSVGESNTLQDLQTTRRMD